MAYNPENPSCPRCGSPMKGVPVKGKTHWICNRNPDCDGAIRPTTKPKKFKKVR